MQDLQRHLVSFSPRFSCYISATISVCFDSLLVLCPAERAAGGGHNLSLSGGNRKANLAESPPTVIHFALPQNDTNTHIFSWQSDCAKRLNPSKLGPHAEQVRFVIVVQDPPPISWVWPSRQPYGVMSVSLWRTPPPLPGMRLWWMVGALGLYADKAYLFISCKQKIAQKILVGWGDFIGLWNKWFQQYPSFFLATNRQTGKLEIWQIKGKYFAADATAMQVGGGESEMGHWEGGSNTSEGRVTNRVWGEPQISSNQKSLEREYYYFASFSKEEEDRLKRFQRSEGLSVVWSPTGLLCCFCKNFVYFVHCFLLQMFWNRYFLDNFTTLVQHLRLMRELWFVSHNAWKDCALLNFISRQSRQNGSRNYPCLSHYIQIS